jgi:c(7)-type cytochrome triheme protein
MRSRYRIIEYLSFALFIGLPLIVCAGDKDGGFIVYPGSQAGPVVFSHLTHGEKNAGYQCNQCHPAGSKEKLTVTMGKIRQGQVCGTCHNGSTKSIHGRAASAVEDCSSCHMPSTDIVFKLNRMDPVRFSHNRHLSVDPAVKTSHAKGLSCRDCHPTPFARTKGPIGMEAPHEATGCAHCHNGWKRNGRVIFAATTRCLTCHKD